MFAYQRIAEERSHSREMRCAADASARGAAELIYALTAGQPELRDWLRWPVHETAIIEARARLIVALRKDVDNGNLR